MGDTEAAGESVNHVGTPGGQSRSLRLWLLATGATCISFIPLVKPLFENGLARGSDTVMHVGNVVEAAYLLREKPPSWDWLPDIAGGYGGPNYLYYNYLAFLFPSTLVNFGLTPDSAIRVWIGVLFLVAAVSSFLWCSLFGKALGGLIGAAQYLWAPYFFTLPYVRGSYPEFTAVALYPLLFYLTSVWIIKKARWSFLAACIVFSLILCCHTLSLLLILPVISLYALTVTILVYKRPYLTRVGTFIVVPVLLSLPFLVGPLLEREKIDIVNQFKDAGLYNSSALPWPAVFNKTPLGNDIASYIIPGRIHLLCWASAVTVVVSGLLKERVMLRLAAVHVVAAFVAVLASTAPIASGLVAAVPVVRFLQFPWRFLGLFNLFACAAFAICVNAIPPVYKGFLAVAVPIGCMLLYSGLIPMQNQNEFPTHSRAGIRSSLLTLDQENKYMPKHSYLPKSVAPPVLLQVAAPEAHVRVLDEKLNDYTFVVEVNQEVSAWFHQYWFDNWRLEIDGKRKAMKRGGDLGICTFAIPAGKHHVHIYFCSSGVMQIARCFSLCAWAGVISAICVAGLKRFNKRVKGKYA